MLYGQLLRLVADMAASDARLTAASRGFARAEMQKAALLRSVKDDASSVAEAVHGRRNLYLEALCTERAGTLDGHRARALAFLIWDAGELARRAHTSGHLEDRLLWAVISDLARTNGGP